MKPASEPTSSLWIGERREISKERVTLPLGALLRHAMALGSSGSGKTVLCKSIVEEVVRSGVPAICIDPQGDLCSLAAEADPEKLAAKGIDPALAQEFRKRAEVVVFTPASQKGIPLCADPVERGVMDLDPADRTQVLGRTATMVTSLLGYDPESDDGGGLIAVLDTVLSECAERGAALSSLGELAARLGELERQGFGDLERLLEGKKIRVACQRLARLEVGARRLMFHDGLPIDIPTLLGKAGTPGSTPGKTRISVIYLNTLGSQDDKDFFVAALVNRLYSYMLAHPSSSPQALFYIDEVAPFVPPVRKPACKEALMLLFKQARKYGVCCLMATQNPGDVDYKAMAQFGTWALGRMTTRQDLKKVEPTVKSLAPVGCEALLESLPGLDPGQFIVLSPDSFEAPVPLAGRWLYSRHETWDEQRVTDHSEAQRSRFLKAAAPPPATKEPPASGKERPLAKELSAKQEPVSTKKAASPKRSDLDEVASDKEPEAGDSLPVEQVESEISATYPRKAASAKTTPSKAASAKTAPSKAPKGKSSHSAKSESEDFAQILAQEAFMAVVDFAERAGVSEAKARNVLKNLVSGGQAKTYKDGRTQRYFSVAEGGRPDLDLGRKVLVAAARIDPEAAYRLGQSLARSGVLGLGQAETFERAELRHHPLYKLDFEERVARDVFSRFLGSTHDLRIGSIYLHPTTLDILVLAPQGLFFSDRPAEHASAISDLDGVTHPLEATPGALNLDEESWRQRRDVDAVKQSFRERFSAQPGLVTPLFVPLWRIVLRTGQGSGYRLVTLDGILGKPVDWPVSPSE